MAYTDSIFLKAQVRMSELFSEPELRANLRPVNEVLLANAPALFINLQDIVDSEGVQTAAYYFQRTTAAVANARNSTHTGAVGTSANQQLSFTVYARNFKHSVKDDHHNVLGAGILANELYNAILDLHIDIETDSIAFLESNKSGVNAYSGDYATFDGSDDILNVAVADKDRFFSIVRTAMKSNSYRRPLQTIFSTDGEIIFNEQAAQVSTTGQNLAYQLAGFNFSGVTDGITPDADEWMQMYSWEQGRVAMVARIPKLNVDGLETPVADYFTVEDPFGSGMTFAVHAYWVKSDAGNKTQDVYREYQISVDIARAAAPLSVSTETVIHKSALLNV